MRLTTMTTIMTTIAGLALLAVTLAGCNAVYFYETDKISLNVEARPDSTGPVQGSFGLKQRVVAFVPKRNGPLQGAAADTEEAIRRRDEAKRLAVEEAKRKLADPTTPPEVKSYQLAQLAKLVEGTSDSDAMSVLSALRFHKLPKPDGAPWYKLTHMTIDSALITGEAAKAVVSPGYSLGALSGQRVPAGSLVGRVALQSIYAVLSKASATDARAKAIVGRLDTLAQRVPDKYPLNLYKLDTNSPNNLLRDVPRGTDMAPHEDFWDALIYWETLDNNVDVLQRALAKKPAVTFMGRPLDDTTKIGLIKELEDATAVRDAFRRDVGALPALGEAIDLFKQIF